MTRYYIDRTMGLVTRMEFDYDQGRDPFSGEMHALTEVYEFSNYQDVPLAAADAFRHGGSAKAGTVKFPMEIDRCVVGEKVETMISTEGPLNGNLRPENFRK